MSEILFIRHAETDSAGTFCGHSDPDVNEVGMEQIAALVAGWRGGRFGGPVEAVYTSDLARAKTTGRVVAGEFEVTCVARPGLREINFGAWEGLSWDEVWEFDRSYAERWVAEFPALSAPDGEAYEDFRRRVLDEVAELVVLETGRRIAVVTHAGVLRVILTELLAVSVTVAWKRTEAYCCVVAYGGKVELDRLTDERERR